MSDFGGYVPDVTVFFSYVPTAIDGTGTVVWLVRMLQGKLLSKLHGRDIAAQKKAEELIAWRRIRIEKSGA